MLNLKKIVPSYLLPVPVRPYEKPCEKAPGCYSKYAKTEYRFVSKNANHPSKAEASSGKRAQMAGGALFETFLPAASYTYCTASISI